jgi:hypothetical protein
VKGVALLAGITGLNAAENIDVCLLCMMRVVQVQTSANSRSLVQRRTTDFMCVTECDQVQHTPLPDNE